MEGEADSPELPEVVGAVAEGSEAFRVPAGRGVVIDDCASAAGAGVGVGRAVREGDEAVGEDAGEESNAEGHGRGLLGCSPLASAAEAARVLGAEGAEVVEGRDVGKPVGGLLERGATDIILK